MMCKRRVFKYLVCLMALLLLFALISCKPDADAPQTGTSAEQSTVSSEPGNEQTLEPAGTSQQADPDPASDDIFE